MSNGHGEAVARVCNYSSRHYTFKVDSFLGLAELVVYVTGADGRAAGLSLATNRGLGVSRQPDASIWPELPDLQSDLMLDSMAGLHASNLSASHKAKDASSAPKGMYDHVQF